MNGHLKLIRLPIAAIALLLAFGCTQPPEIKPDAKLSADQAQALTEAAQQLASGDFNAAADAYEKLAGEIPLRRDELLLRAAEARVDGGEPQSSLQLLQRIDRRGLTGLQNQGADLTRAQALVDLERAPEALALLAPRPPSKTSAELTRRRLSIRADALLQMGNRLESARALSELDLMLPDMPRERLANQQRLLRTLGVLGDPVLSRLVTDDPLFTGWLELARATRAYELRPQQADSELAAWRERHPTHPAMPQLLARYRGLADRDLSELGRVAVLLPTSGRYARAATAIRDGLLDAYYRTQPHRRPELMFYDTSNQAELWPLLQQALADGAAAAIGPLQKPAVEQLTQAGDLTIPVLALNRVELQIPPPPGLYQFGLAPEDEAAQAAEKAWADGALSALALVPDSAWGERLARSFQGRFEELGGQVLERQSYDRTQHDFGKPIMALLNLDQSRERHKALVKVLGQNLEFEPQPRRDAGALFLAAKAGKARQIWPQLQFHRIGGLPVYTTSHIHARRFTPPQDLDLVGMNFPEIPWLLTKETEGPDGTLGRLYAMGMDSYRLLAALPRLTEFPESRLKGATGQLSLDALRRVHRRLPWARMGKQGPENLGYLPEPAEDRTAMPQQPALPVENPDAERP